MKLTEAEIRENMRIFREKQRLHIRQFGRTTVGIFGVEGQNTVNDSFVYTIGNTLKGLPELLVVGVYNDGGMLNLLSDEMIRRGRAFDHFETFTFPGRTAPVAIVDAAEVVKERFTCQAGHWFPNGYRVQQVVLSDKAGLLPWESGCAESYRDVIIHAVKPRVSS